MTMFILVKQLPGLTAVCSQHATPAEPCAAHFQEVPGQAEGQDTARGKQMHLAHSWSSLVS